MAGIVDGETGLSVRTTKLNPLLEAEVVFTTAVPANQENGRLLVDSGSVTVDVSTPGEVSLQVGGGGGIAPGDAEYITAATSTGLSAERVATDTATVTWDFSTPAQAKANVVGSAVTGVVAASVSFTTGHVVLGRNTNSAGAGEEVTATQELDWIGSTRGQVLYRGNSAWSALATGTAGQALLTGGAGADPSWGSVVRPATTSNFTAGYTSTTVALGTISSGTVTPDATSRQYQSYTNGGAHTLAPPTAGTGDACDVVVDITNNASAGAITTSGFTKVTGDAFTTTNGHKFTCYLKNGIAGSILNVQAMQ